MILNLGFTIESPGVVKTVDARALLQSIKLESKVVNDAYKTNDRDNTIVRIQWKMFYMSSYM